jgi:hypothetical protein
MSVKSDNRMWRLITIIVFVIISRALPADGGEESFLISDTDFILNGQPFQIRCGEMRFARIPREYGMHRLRKEGKRPKPSLSSSLASLMICPRIS